MMTGAPLSARPPRFVGERPVRSHRPKDEADRGPSDEAVWRYRETAVGNARCALAGAGGNRTLPYDDDERGHKTRPEETAVHGLTGSAAERPTIIRRWLKADG